MRRMVRHRRIGPVPQDGACHDVIHPDNCSSIESAHDFGAGDRHEQHPRLISDVALPLAEQGLEVVPSRKPVWEAPRAVGWP